MRMAGRARAPRPVATLAAGTGTPRWVAPALLASAAGWVVYAALVGWWGPGDFPVRDVEVYSALMVGTALLVGARGLLLRVDRVAWLVLALGLLLSAIGDIVYSTYVVRLDPEPFPSVADTLYLALYPAVYVAVVLLVRRRVRDLPRSMWIDGVVALLAVSSLLAAWLVVPIESGLSGGVAATVVGLAYPIADSLMLLVAILGLVLLGSAAGGALWWFSGALAVMGLADLTYWARLSSSGYFAGTWLDVLWPLANVMLAFAAWRPVRLTVRRHSSQGLLLIAPVASVLVAGGVLVYGTSHAAPAVAVAMAAASLVGVVVRLAATVTETGRMMVAQRVAATDELTELPNRRGFTTRASRVLATVDADSPAALLMLDLDGFKEVNDSLGHHAGDRLLIGVATRLRESLRSPDDVLGRLGGDEFALMLARVDAREAVQVAGRIALALAPAFDIDGVKVQTSASIGLALAPTHGTDLSLLLRRADIAMYRAKAGHLGYAAYDGQGDQLGEDRLQRTAELRRAVQGGELVLHYQPKVELATGRVVAVEALVRWERPGHGIVPPDDFLPLVEEAGLMPALNTAVLEMAVAQSALWREAGLLISIAVNLSAGAVVDEDLPRYLDELLARFGVPADLLQIEITEEALLRDRPRAQAVLARLRQAGIRISIDDYGSGYSSLAYLRELTVDEIKLDKSFVLPMADDARAASIVRSTIDLAHALGLQIVAEGVEQRAAAQDLAACRCDTAQGFFWSKALPAAELTAWLAEHGSRHEPERVEQEPAGL